METSFASISWIIKPWGEIPVFLIHFLIREYEEKVNEGHADVGGTGLPTATTTARMRLSRMTAVTPRSTSLENSASSDSLSPVAAAGSKERIKSEIYLLLSLDLDFRKIVSAKTVE